MHQPTAATGRAIFAIFALLMAATAARGHPPVATAALVDVSAEGQVRVTIIHDALAFALNDTSARIGDAPMLRLLDGPEEELAAAFEGGRQRFLIGFHLFADGEQLPVELAQSPDLEGAHRWKSAHPGRLLPCKLDFVARARLPAGARSIALQFPEIMADTLLVIERPGMEPLSFPLRPNETSPAIDVQMAHAPEAAGPAPESRPASAGLAAGSAARTPPADQISAAEVAWRCIRLGFVHIVPQGPDHCLFVLGLFLLSPRFKTVLWQISAFTVAHTLTLTLTSLHIIGLSSGIVEPTIAASIVFVGIENLVVKKVSSWRVAVAFAFGLVHGMGVATAFNEAGFPAGQLVASLGAFTVGVEAGHVLVLLAAFITLSWTREKAWYRKRIAVPLSLAIAGIAMFWFVQRVMAAW